MLRPFSIDRYPVTNWIFSQFVEATGYLTDAERYGWSFVFWLHIPRANPTFAVSLGRGSIFKGRDESGCLFSLAW